MHHRTLEQITEVATVFPAGKPSSRHVRRERLRRLAMVLDEHAGPIRLLSEIEYLSRSDFSIARCDFSPLTVAFQDDKLRRQGLAGDRLGDAMTFFGLTPTEAHHLFCDCHYSMPPDARIIARRVRALAERRTVLEVTRAIWSRWIAA